MLEPLAKDSATEDRLAVHRWYEQKPIHLPRHMLKDVMVVVMPDPDTDTIRSAINQTVWAYDRATLKMIELAAMWYMDVDGLSSNDADHFWGELEDKYEDYRTEKQEDLGGEFGIRSADRADYKRCFERFIDYRNYSTGSLTGWLIKRDEIQLAAWWLSSRHTAMTENLWPDVTDPDRERTRLDHDVRKLANQLNVGATLIRHLHDLIPCLEKG